MILSCPFFGAKSVSTAIFNIYMKSVSVHTGAQPYKTKVTDGAHHWIVDEPTALGGLDTGPDPFAMLLSSLGSCTAITLKMYANRKGWDVQDIHINLNLVSTDEGGQKQTVFISEMTIDGNLDETQLKRLRQIARACPISKLLEGKISIETLIQNSGNEHSTAG